jgi:DNA-binding CsgD family transcriptional regulator
MILNEEIEEYVRLYASGLSYEQIGNKLKKNRTNIYLALKRRNLLNSRPRLREIPNSEIQVYIELVKKGYTCQQIANVFGKKTGSEIGAILKRRGINLKTIKEMEAIKNGTT